MVFNFRKFEILFILFIVGCFVEVIGVKVVRIWFVVYSRCRGRAVEIWFRVKGVRRFFGGSFYACLFCSRRFLYFMVVVGYIGG